MFFDGHKVFFRFSSEYEKHFSHFILKHFSVYRIGFGMSIVEKRAGAREKINSNNKAKEGKKKC